MCSCTHSKNCVVETLLCAAVGTASTVCGDTTVCSFRHSKYCVWRHYCVQLQAQQVLCVETLLCAAVGTASTVCGDTTVCSCRHSKYCVVETLLCAAVGTASTVRGDTTVCSCRHSTYCVWRHYCVQL